MKRKIYSEEEMKQLLYEAQQFLEQDMQRSLRTRNFGRGYFYHFIRQAGEIAVSQHRLFEYYRQIYLEEVERRQYKNFKHCTAFTVPGLNFI